MPAEPAPREFFAALTRPCGACGRDVFAAVMDVAAGGADDCAACRDFHRRLADCWRDLTQNPEELKTIAADARARHRLRRIFASYGERGVHRPLILPSTLKLELTSRCNLTCAHCLARAGTAGGVDLPLDTIRDILAQGRELGVTTVGLVGGEPLLRQDLGDIIDEVGRQRMAFSISTNGMLLDPRRAELIRRPNLLKVSVSVDGTEDYHNRLRGHPQAYQKTLAGLRLLAEQRIKTAVAMVITRDNCRMVEPVLQAAIACGAAFFVVNDMIPVGRGAEIEHQCLPYAEYREHTARVLALSQAYGKRIQVLWKGMRPEGPGDDSLGLFVKSLCGAALTELTITPDGYVQPCPFLPRTRENIHARSLREIWYHSDELKTYQTHDDLKGGCGKCPRQLSCSGCRARALGHTGDAKAGDVRCPRCQEA